MINYQSLRETYAPAFTRIDRRSPYAMPGAHADVYGALAAKNAATLGAARDQALTDFGNEKLAAQQRAALDGLQNLVQARKQQDDMANQRNSMRYGTVNSLLSGLFR